MPNVNFLLNYVETMRGRDSNDKYLKEHLEERRFYSSIKDDDYLKYVNKGSNEKLDYVEYSGNKEKSHGVFNEKGLMTSEMIKEMRTMLRNTDSPIWHGVISFTEEFGDTYCNTFEKAFELMKNELPKFFKNAGLIPENIVWYAGLHENTDNKHIHLSFFEKEPFPSKCGLDTLFDNSGDARLYVFSPLHYLDRNYGYLVFADSTFPIANPLYIIWLNSIGNSVENMRKHTMLINAMVKLDDANIRDPLTGVYNRFGMERYFAIVKEKCIDKQLYLFLSFADIDGLKTINDVYGHEEGDRIIRDTGHILQDEVEDAYVVRYGGDEFIVMGTAFSEEEAESYWMRVQRSVDEYNAEHEGMAVMSISSGYKLFRLDPYSGLEECIGEVDKKMYEEKNRKKARKKEAK